MELKPISFFRNVLTPLRHNKVQLNPVALRRVETHAVRIDSVGPGLQMMRNGNSAAVWRASKPHGPGLQLFNATITTIGNDTLTCTIDGESTTVAKPYMLRRTPFHGVEITFPNGSAITYSYTGTQRRTATDGTHNETHQVNPLYFIGEVISVVLKDDDATGAEYEDANTAGRHWCAV